MYCMRLIQNLVYYIIVYSDILRHIHILFRHIQGYCGIFRTLCNSIAYSETCLVQNSGTLTTRYIFRNLPRHILPYSERCVMLAYSKNFAIFRIFACLRLKAYLEPYETSKMKLLTKLVKGYNYSSTTSIVAAWQGSEHASVSISGTLYSDFRLCTISGILRTQVHSEPCLHSFFYMDNFIRTKDLILAKNLRTS